MKRFIMLLTAFVAVVETFAQEGYGFIDEGPFGWDSPKLVADTSDSITSEWKWLYSWDYQTVSTSYPVEEFYYKYDAHPHYKVKRLCYPLGYEDTHKVVYDGENIIYIELSKEDNIKNIESTKDFFNEIVRQLCIYDFRQNKYDIQNTTPAQVKMIERILVERKDEGDRMERSYFGYLHSPHFWSSYSTKKEQEDFDRIKAQLNQLKNDNVYTTAKRYIEQLYKDWRYVSFTGKRLDGLNFLIIPDGKDVGVKISMSVKEKKIEYSYSVMPVFCNAPEI